MEKAQAIELVEKWLRAEGMKVNEPDGVRVDHARIRRSVEGWRIPWGNVGWLDHGDSMQQIFPPPALIVSEPDGQLRHANTTPHPAYSVLATWRGEPQYKEIIDPEYRDAGLYNLGVPQNAVVGWEITYPDGRSVEKVNPQFRIGPVRAGMPKPQNKLEILLGYLQMGFARDRFLLGLLGSEVLVPLKQDSDELHESVGTTPGMLAVASSPRRLRRAVRWMRMTVPTFVARWPNTGMVINEGRFPTTTVTAAELAEVSGAHPGYEPGEPVIVTEPGLDGSLDEYAAQLQRDFNLAVAPVLATNHVVDARDSGHELTLEERKKLLLGKAWLLRPEYQIFSRRSRAAVLGDPADEITVVSWPEDLHANGLVARYDSAGRFRPAVSTFGKFPRAGEADPERSWHAVVGAYVGFALGDALGTPAEGLSPQQLEERYGEGGLRGLEAAFERPGQVSWRTQLLLFLTEGAVGGLSFKYGETDGALRTTRAAHARWLVTQGVPWQQAAGPLAAHHPEPDGRLVRIRALHARRGVPQQLLEKIRAVVADPGSAHGLHGPLTLPWALPGAVSRFGAGVLADGWYRQPVDLQAAGALSAVLERLFSLRWADFPLWYLTRQVRSERLKVETHEGAEEVNSALQHVDSRVHEFLERDQPEMAAVARERHPTLGVLGRALLLAGKREAEPRTALLTAANHPGDAALTTALVGALLGARLGVAGLPREWVDALDVGDVVEEIASDAFWHFARQNPYNSDFDREEWDRRYPRW